jgi:TPR repeat protein
MRLFHEKLVVATLLALSSFAHAQVAQLSAAEIEKRNAAATFATVREGSLLVVLGECSHLLADLDTGVERVAREWFGRNKAELDAAYVWLDQYLAYLKSKDATAFQQASNDLVRTQGNSALQNARVFFARKIPDKSSCEKAVKTYSVSQLDVKNIALNPGYEQFAEFAETLARIRAEPSFMVPRHLKLGFDNASQKLVGIGNIASLDAADAARERGDGLTRLAVFQGMAKRGDGAAAQSVGLMLLNGDQVEKSSVEAYRWFYAAWSLSDMDGLNALGVMNRDGLGVSANPLLAQSAFYLATAAARSQAALDRASRNSNRLGGQISPEAKIEIACTTLIALDDALRKPIQNLQPVVRGKAISSPDRRLGEVVKELAEVYRPTSCK